MRRVLVDTNVLLSALVFPHGTAARAFWRVVNEDSLVLTEVILHEAEDVVGRKWPHLLDVLAEFVQALSFDLLSAAATSVEIRDPGDQSILDAAIACAVDVILTGDKDFLALGLDRPLVLTPRDFLDLRD